MDNLERQPTNVTCEVSLDAQSGLFKFDGRSIPEDPDAFFGDIIAWIDEYFKDGAEGSRAEFNLEYVNSGSSKYFLEVIRRLDDYFKKGKENTVVWMYEEDDESMMELGELYQDSVSLPFELKEIII